MDYHQKQKKKKENRLRTVDWHLRLTQSEADELTKLILISGKSRRDYVLNLARFGVVVDLSKVNKELQKQGVNLNQIARKLNSGEYPSQETILETIKETQKEWQSLRLLISAVLSAR